MGYPEEERNKRQIFCMAGLLDCAPEQAFPFPKKKALGASLARPRLS